jgi:hypothetical protein
MEASMKRAAGWCIAVLAAGGAWAVPAVAQDAAKGKPTAAVKVLIDNARVVAGEVSWAPGTQNSTIMRPTRVIRALVGGPLTVVYADGRTETRNFETGGVYYFEPDTVANFLRNDGTSEVKLYFVFIK